MTQASSKTSWRESLAVYRKPAAIRMLFLGFSSGLPLLLVMGTLSFWLREAGIDLKTIGLMSWVGLVYGFKWLWAPLVDSLRIPYLTQRLGRRRAWLLLTQVALIILVGMLGQTNPVTHLHTMAWLALMTAFASATQDIALDAYRMESAPVREQAALAATYQTGYRVAMIWSGAGALALAAWSAGEPGYDLTAWSWAYGIMSASFVVGLVATLLSPESKKILPAALSEQRIEREQFLRENYRLPGLLCRFGAWFYEAACLPFIDFFSRYRFSALLLLALIATYRISDIVMGVMANPFYLDLGYTKEEVAAISKVFGVIMSLVGAFVGGFISIRIGIIRTLFLGAALSSLTNLIFSWLSTQSADITYLVLTISADNLASGIASVAFVAYLSSLTSVAYTATQYALFSSVMLLLPKFLAGFSGFVVEWAGYAYFFAFTALLGIPVLVLIFFAARLEKKG